MNSLINENIDLEVKKILNNLGIEIEEYGEITFQAIEVITNYLQYYESNYNMGAIMHIFTYNYIYYSQFNSSFIAKYQDITFSDLMQKIENFPNFFNRLLLTYLKILYHPNLYELVTDNYDTAKELENLGDYHIESVDLISDKFRKYLCELYYIYTSFEPVNVNEIILYILNTDNDPFNIYKKYFTNKKEYLSYKGLLIKTLYLHTYSYLLKLRDSSYLSKDNKKILKDIEKRLHSNNLYTLPDDKEYCKLMIEAFYCFGYNGLTVTKKEAIKRIKKETRSRVNSFLLYSIDD